jgi:hypothetical protein
MASPRCPQGQGLLQQGRSDVAWLLWMLMSFGMLSAWLAAISMSFGMLSAWLTAMCQCAHRRRAQLQVAMRNLRAEHRTHHMSAHVYRSQAHSIQAYEEARV